MPNTPENRLRFKLYTAPNPHLALGEIGHIEKFKHYLNTKRYSESTVKPIWKHCNLFFYNNKEVNKIDNKDIVNFYDQYILEKKLSISFQNQLINAIKLYFKTIKETTIIIEKIYRPKREKLLPNVLIKEEVKKILEAHSNVKHKTMLCMIYSCGLRRSELINLKPQDIDSKRGVVIIKQAKGRKNRIAPLPPNILLMLREYYKTHKPVTYLFEGREFGTKLR